MGWVVLTNFKMIFINKKFELQSWSCILTKAHVRSVRLAYQSPASSIFLSQRTSHQQPASSTLLSEQTSTSHQSSANRTGYKLYLQNIMVLYR
jgi:hypothetical protein